MIEQMEKLAKTEKIYLFILADSGFAFYLVVINTR